MNSPLQFRFRHYFISINSVQIATQDKIVYEEKSYILIHIRILNELETSYNGVLRINLGLYMHRLPRF